MWHIGIPLGILFALQASLAQVDNEHCKDEFNLPISSCDRCLWRPGCHWCPEKANSNLARGCIKKTIPCRDEPIVSKPLVDVRQSRPISKSDWIMPQQVVLSLSPKTPATVSFQAQLFDLPVDIYFLMDLSNSMAQHKSNLVEAAEEIAREVMSLTSDYRFGFGSFSDKPTPPFSSELSKYKEKIDQGERNQPPPYSFHHQVSMTADTARFKQKVSSAQLAGNVDSPEAGMDALMQVIACEEIVGWRQSARKVVILITDEDSHFAYDGHMGGIPAPNDGQCHLSPSSENPEVFIYDKQLNLDYPSFGHIGDKLNEKNMAIIFAVDIYMESLYKDISRFVQGTSDVGILSTDSSSLTKIIKSQYSQIKSRLAFEVSSNNNDDLTVQLKSQSSGCDNASNTSLICSNVTQGQTMTIEVQITAQDDLCTRTDGSNRVRVALVGSDRQELRIDLACEQCACSRNGIPQSPDCHGNGTFHCGGCTCNADYVGQACECPRKGSTTDLSESCIEEGQFARCNNHGECNCGKCHCQAQYHGDYCQCHYDQCPTRVTGQPCSGHGRCECDSQSQTSCNCYEGWRGPDCSCPVDEGGCRTKFMEEPCLGRGQCVCGQCQCATGFYGQFCQKSTAMSTCEKLEPCAKLRAFKPNGTDANEIQSEWEEECRSNLMLNRQYVFGGMQNVFKACEMNKTQSSLVYNPVGGQDEECQSLIVAYQQQLKEKDKLQLAVNGSLAPSGFSRTVARGDISPWEESKFLITDPSRMERCFGEYDRCSFSFYHNQIEDDKYFRFEGEEDPGKIFVAFRNVSGVYQAATSCTAVPMALIVGSMIGLLFIAGIILLVASIVIVNINDLRRWQQYQAWKGENERQLGEQSNPLYESKTTTFQNPAFSS
eukprot:maker-scaffold425_size175135-snap-gene-0.46 protein:Tk05832 transcript:maker-scaffold425_size175135-snap-gene-0.46-mRNA-1 annotation:"integrin beta-5-like"